MSATSTFVVMACDICQEAMRETNTGMVCWPCSNFIPTEQLWRYDAQIAHVFTSCNTCGIEDESGFINDDGVCMKCEEVDDVA